MIKLLNQLINIIHLKQKIIIKKLKIILLLFLIHLNKKLFQKSQINLTKKNKRELKMKELLKKKLNKLNVILFNLALMDYLQNIQVIMLKELLLYYLQFLVMLMELLIMHKLTLLSTNYQLQKQSMLSTELKVPDLVRLEMVQQVLIAQPHIETLLNDKLIIDLVVLFTHYLKNGELTLTVGTKIKRN